MWMRRLPDDDYEHASPTDGQGTGGWSAVHTSNLSRTTEVADNLDRFFFQQVVSCIHLCICAWLIARIRWGCEGAPLRHSVPFALQERMLLRHG
jgi:hypothetical protein